MEGRKKLDNCLSPVTGKKVLQCNGSRAVSLSPAASKQEPNFGSPSYHNSAFSVFLSSVFELK